MSEKTFYSDAGKGGHRRKEDKKAIEKNWDSIDWSVKSKTCPIGSDEHSGVKVGSEERSTVAADASAAQEADEG